jgi:uncharacterized membrane protein YdjX (TVP38/TMEM64 family)
VAAVILVVAVSVTVFLMTDKIAELKSLGYLGAFSIMLLGNATIILPAPGLTLVFALGSAFHPVPLGLASGAGAALGELTGYLAGLSGRTVVENQTLYMRFEGWMQQYGSMTVLVLAAVPNPFFDLAGVAAGALGLSWHRFLLAAWVGKTIQGILVAYAGALSASWVLKWL